MPALPALSIRSGSRRLDVSYSGHDPSRSGAAGGGCLICRPEAYLRCRRTIVLTVSWEEPVELTVTQRQVGDNSIVSFDGEIDLASATQLDAVLHEIVTVGLKNVIVDLRDVVFLDSTGLGILVYNYRRSMASGNRFELVCTHPPVLKVFSMTGLDKVFSIHDSVDAALAAST